MINKHVVRMDKQKYAGQLLYQIIDTTNIVIFYTYMYIGK